MHARACIALLATALASPALATTYTYKGPLYTEVAGCLTTSMRIILSFTVPAPIPPNSGIIGSAGVTSWSASDGVHSVKSTMKGAALNLTVASDGQGKLFAQTFGAGLNTPKGKMIYYFYSIAVSSDPQKSFDWSTDAKCAGTGEEFTKLGTWTQH